MHRKERAFITLLADFGAGKTTLLYRLKYQACRDCLDNTSRRRPLYLALKEFAPAETLEEYLVRVIRQAYQRLIPPARFWSIAAEGGFFFLLDGFDEIIGGTNSRTRAEIFLRLYPLISSSSPAILTCRPTYFVDDREVDHLITAINQRESGRPRRRLVGRMGLNKQQEQLVAASDRELAKTYVEGHNLLKISAVDAGLVELSVFAPHQIDSFLKKFDAQFRASGNASWRDVKDALLEIYDLSDLVTRPIILSMIKDTVIHGRIDLPRRKILKGASDLYEKYTEIHLRRDWSKGSSRRLLTVDDRRLFAEAIALTMLRYGRLAVPFDLIKEIVQEEGQAKFARLARPLERPAEEIASNIQVSIF